MKDIEQELEKSEIQVTAKDKADGWGDKIRVVFEGKDKDSEVEWKLTLSHEDESFPLDYEKIIGTGRSDSIVVKVKAGKGQSLL